MDIELINMAIPLDWYFGLKVERYIPQRDKDVFNEAHALALRTVALFFEQLPEFEIVGSMVTKFSKNSNMEEVHYQPVLRVAPQEVLNFDPDRKANLLRLLRENLLEFQKVPTRLEGLLRARQFKSLDTWSEADEVHIRALRAILDSRLGDAVTVGNLSFEKRGEPQLQEQHAFKFVALVNSVGRDFVLLEGLKWTKETPFLIGNRKLRVNFRTDDLFEDANTHLDICYSLLIKNQRATFICEVIFADGRRSRLIKGASLVRVVRDQPLQMNS